MRRRLLRTGPGPPAVLAAALAGAGCEEPGEVPPELESELLVDELHDVEMPELGMAVLEVGDETHEADVERCVLAQRLVGFGRAEGQVSLVRLEAHRFEDEWETEISAERRILLDAEDYGRPMAAYEADAIRVRVTSPIGRDDVGYISASRDRPGGPVTMMPEDEPGELPLLRVVYDGETVRATAVGEMPEGVMEPEDELDVVVGHGPFTFAAHCEREAPEL